MEHDLFEIEQGVHRVETISDNRLHAYHLLEMNDGICLVDTAFRGATEDLFEPAIEALGYGISDVSAAIITHADADHHGGTAELRERAPRVTIAAHRADCPMIESTDRLVANRYRRFEDDHGVGYGEDLIEEFRTMISGDAAVDIRLLGGETIAVNGRQFDVLHTPGHTEGHLMLHDSTNGLLIGGDGFFGRGIKDVEGNVVQPPPYHLYADYLDTIQLVDNLDVDTLSFTHYSIREAEYVDNFVKKSYGFVDDVDVIVDDLLAEYDSITLAEAIGETVDRLGTFGLDTDLAYSLSAHFTHRVRRGEANAVEETGTVEYEATR